VIPNRDGRSGLGEVSCLGDVHPAPRHGQSKGQVKITVEEVFDMDFPLRALCSNEGRELPPLSCSIYLPRNCGTVCPLVGRSGESLHTPSNGFTSRRKAPSLSALE
jgi:hypothetical protein